MSRSKRSRRRRRGRMTVPQDVGPRQDRSTGAAAGRPKPPATRHGRPAAPSAFDSPIFSRREHPVVSSAKPSHGQSRPRPAFAAIGLAARVVRGLPPQRAKTRVLWGAGALALAFVVWGLVLASDRPGWFDRARAQALGEQERRRAIAVENRAVTYLTTPRPAGEPWVHALAETEANAWLSHRLRAWFEREHPGSWPGDLADVAVDFRRGAIVLGLRFVDGGASGSAPSEAGRVVSVHVLPWIDADGSVRVQVQGVQVNRLPLPAGRLASTVGRQALPSDLDPELLESIVTALSGAPLVMEPTRAVDRDRAVTVHELWIEDERLVVRCSTGPRRARVRRDSTEANG